MSQTDATQTILNIAFYHFMDLPDPPGIRAQLRSLCLEFHLKGTILVSPEGINGYLAGQIGDVRGFQKALSLDPIWNVLTFKESYSSRIPYRKLMVKLKKEIIPVRDPSVNPAEFTGPRISPEELKSWLDENRDINLVDTRNHYEIEFGTFRGARDLHIDRFQQFADKLKGFSEADKAKPMVMFCTGGIRCEKASVLAIQQGFKEVYQLDGGILKYFEKCGGSHYEGTCFVFDERVALNPQLQEDPIRSPKS